MLECTNASWSAAVLQRCIGADLELSLKVLTVRDADPSLPQLSNLWRDLRRAR